MSSKKYGFFERPTDAVLLQFEEQIDAARKVRRRQRPSKLLPTIAVLRAGIERGFSLSNIRRLIKRECNVVAANSTICRFIKTHPQLRSAGVKTVFAEVDSNQKNEVTP